MRRRRLGQFAASLLTAPTLTTPILARAAGDAAPDAASPAPIPHTTQRDLVSRGGQPFRLFLHVPPGGPPPGGWPVITVLDANAIMGLVVDTMRVQALAPRETGFRSAAVIAGIGYRTEAPYEFYRRSFDLSPPPVRQLPPLPDGRPGARVGGADELLDFIEEVVKPLVAREAAVDPARHAVLGHSFGGLFVLHALFSRPGLFRDHVAGSASIWWQDRAVLASAERFIARPDRPAGLGLLLTAGAYEQGLAPWQEGRAGAAERAASLADHRLVEDARDLAARLRLLPGMRVGFEVFAGETHMSSLPLVVHRGLQFILRG